MAFEEQEFNALMQYLDLFVDDTLVRKIRTYATVSEHEGKQLISVKLFGDGLRQLCWLLMANLPESHKDYFSPMVEEIKEREFLYRKKKEEEAQALYEGIKKELLLDPNITGADIARKLNVSRDRVYAIWHQVRKDISGAK